MLPFTNNGDYVAPGAYPGLPVLASTGTPMKSPDASAPAMGAWVDKEAILLEEEKELQQGGRYITPALGGTNTTQTTKTDSTKDVLFIGGIVLAFVVISRLTK